MRRQVAILLSALALGVTFIATSPATAPASAEQPARDYVIKNAKSLDDDRKIRETGVVVDGYEHSNLYVKAKPSQVAELRRLGFKVEGIGILATSIPVDPGYTDFPEMVAAVDAIVAAFPALASKQVIGQSFEGKDLVVMKISDNVGDDEDEPEMLFTANQHAREHLTVEMALFLANMLTSQYATDPKIKKIVDTREIWIVPMVNPDGVQFDLTTGANYQSWRKNRQPNTGTTAKGTDLNRNWAYKFDCCGGASDLKSADTYHGPSAFSAPETKKLSDFVISRRVGGVQQIKLHLDIHTYSELVLWPFGYTNSSVVTGMTQDEYDTHKAIGTQMALSNGYWPTQASGLYIADGIIGDWMWADQKIVSFTYEMFPKYHDTAEFFPPASVIPAETQRNKDALMRFAAWADCPYRAIGKEHVFCTATNDYVMTDGAVTVAQGSSTSVTFSANKTGGSDQNVAIEIGEIPPGVTVTAPLTVPTDNSAQTVNISTSSTVTPGEYIIVLTGTGSLGTVRTSRIKLTVTGNASCAGSDTADHNIPDGFNSVTATIHISGCGGNASSAMRLDLKVAHGYLNDLLIILFAPSGQQFRAHDRQGASANNIDRSYTFDMSAATADGDWTLEAFDLSSGTAGKVDSWTITLK